MNIIDYLAQQLMSSLNEYGKINLNKFVDTVHATQPDRRYRVCIRAASGNGTTDTHSMIFTYRGTKYYAYTDKNGCTLERA